MAEGYHELAWAGVREPLGAFYGLGGSGDDGAEILGDRVAPG